MPKVSIIIPIFNVELYLYECLLSIIHQTHNDLEIVCIDDGSTDNSGRILDKFVNIDKRIIAVHQKNKGVSSTRNKALDIITGDYVMFVDSDDWLDLDVIEKTLRYSMENNLDICSFSYVSEHGKMHLKRDLFAVNKVMDEVSTKKMARRIIGPIGKELRLPLRLDSYGTIWGKLYRRSTIEGLFFESLEKIGTAEDSLFNMFAYNKAQRTGYYHKCYYHYRSTNTNSITSVFQPRLKERWKKQYNIISKSFSDKESQIALQNRIAINLYGLTRTLLSAKSPHKEISDVLKDPIYFDAKAQLELKYMHPMWAFFFYLIKKDRVILIICFHKIVKLAQRILK